MSGSALELLDLVARWIHVIAGIMWIGNSLLFNWLDRNLRVPSSTAHAALGEIWLLHSGGFYFVEKTLLAGHQVPRPLHWFKWQAYTTWLSGMALLVVVYYLGGRAVLTDPGVAGLSQNTGIAIGVGAIFGGFGFYNAIQRFVAPRAPTLAAATWLGGLIAISIALTRLLSGRAAFLHVGAMLGTIMAGNVFLTIVPSQHDLVRSVREGGGAGDAAISARAKRVSIHNNYFTFPVIVLMVSNHFPAVYGTRWNWLLLLVVSAGGAAVRYVLNIRFAFAHWRPALAAVMTVTVLAMYGLLQIPAAATPAIAGPIPDRPTFADARHVIDRRCAVCHSAQPVDLTFGPAPAGVMFDTPEQIIGRAARINERAVVTRTMPPGNKTNITDTERAVLGRWIAHGAIAR